MFVRYTNARGDMHSVDTPAHADDAMGALRYMVDAYPGEVLWVIRGRDVLALPTLFKYVKECHSHGLEHQALRAVKHAGRFRDWQHSHPELLKIPDAPFRP